MKGEKAEITEQAKYGNTNETKISIVNGSGRQRGL